MTSKQAQVTPNLAKGYGLTVPAGAPLNPRGQVSVTIPETMPRLGLLGPA